jgi:hypothetical protein
MSGDSSGARGVGVSAGSVTRGVGVSAGSVARSSVTVDVEPGWTGSEVGVDYSTLPGCLPKTYGHRLGLWQGSVMNVSLAINFIGSTTLSLHFVTLPGYDPVAAANWIGLWKGQPFIYSNQESPLATAKVTSSANEDDVAFNGVGLAINTTYTAVYFMGAALTTAAASIAFTTFLTSEPTP